MTIRTIEQKVLEKNDLIAARNRGVFEAKGLFAINMVSSPGSGKTSLVERTLEHLRGRIRMAVVEGDVQTDLDALRVSQLNVPVVQIVTHGGCHLEAQLVEEALGELDLNGIQLLMIENVGNLVCPSNYDLGEHIKVVVVSTTEGDDKPLKYPGMFRKASVLVINKTDLLPYVNSKPEILKANALRINPGLRVFETSCTTGQGIADWSTWLEQQVSVPQRRQ